MKKIVFFTVLSSAIIGISQANAYEWDVNAKVTLVQPGYMPNEVSFIIDQAGGSCAAGSWMRWVPAGNTEAEKIANANAVYSTLMTALVADKTLHIYGVNEGCTAEFIHMY